MPQNSHRNTPVRSGRSAQGPGARWHEYPSHETESGRRQNIWGGNNTHTQMAPTSDDDALLVDTTAAARPISPESTSASPPQHEPYTYPNLLQNSSSSAWVVIPLTTPKSTSACIDDQVQAVAPPPSHSTAQSCSVPAVTPDNKSTPSRSNVIRSKSRAAAGVKRSLHNSHRKQRLHSIRPREDVNAAIGQDNHHHPNALSVPQRPIQQQYMTQQHRGNGVVLDLTSLFSPDAASPKTLIPPSPTETATTAASTHPQQQQQQPHTLNQSPHPNSSSVPPWKAHHKAASNVHATVASPVTVPGQGHDHHHLYPHPHHSHSIHNNNHSMMDDAELQWDTKSQTTLEALLTERQCQALTQWLNFALVGEQANHHQQAEGHHQSNIRRAQAPVRRRVGDQHPHYPHLQEEEEDDFVDELTMTNTGSWSRSTTPTRTTAHKRATTPTSVYVRGRSTTPTSKRSTTPTSKRLTDNTTSTNINNKRRHRRLSMFQYAQSYDHAHEQAHHWFLHSAQWKELRVRIRCEISSGKLTLREDRNLYANVGCREQLLSLFLSYRPAWLTLALEVVMNESLPLGGTTAGSTVVTSSGASTVATAMTTLHHGQHHHSLPSTKQLKQFIVQRVLSDEKLLSKYNQGRGSRVPSGQFEEAYLNELRPLVLYRILVLVFFLDRAAGRYQSSLGNLFHASSSNNNPFNVKSTAQVLVCICREFLSRQGDILKQLARVNLHVFHNQDPLDEIEFRIANFAIDLRDGVRLCRLVEVLWLLPRLKNNANRASGLGNNKYPLLSQLRIPAISRLQKIHNVNIALAALQEKCQIGLPQDMQAHHIVDGQRRMVMRLIWTIVLMHCFDNASLLTQRQLEAEIADIHGLRKHYERQREKRRQRQAQEGRQLPRLNTLDLMELEAESLDSVTMVSSSDNIDSSLAAKGKKCGPSLTLRKDHHKSNKPYTTPYMPHSRSSSFDAEDSFSCNSNMLLEELGAVQQWKALLWQWCEQVCTFVEKQEKAGNDDGGSEPTRPLNNLSSGQWMSVDLTNGKALCCLIHHYHPTLLPREELRISSTVIDGPPTRIETNQKSRRQKQKPRIAPDYHIRLAHRRLCELGGIPPMMLMPFSTPGKHNKQTQIAPLSEEKSILVYLYHVCSRLLESRHQVQNVVFVQQRYRYLRWVALQKQKRLKSQLIWKHWQERKDNYFRAQKQKYGDAVMVIESFTRHYHEKLLKLKGLREERVRQNLAILPIQMRARIFLAVKQYRFMLGRRDAAIAIQSKYRQFQDYLSYQLLLLETIPAISTIQRHWRGYVQRQGYAALIDSVILMQSFTRGAVLVRKSLLGSWYSAATCIQKFWRGFNQQMHYQLELLDIVAVQCMVRKQQAKHVANIRTEAVALLQRGVRIFLSRLILLRLQLEKRSTIQIQCAWRSYVATRKAAKIRAMIALAHATLVIQRSWRRTLFLRERNVASITIQTQYRMWSASRDYCLLCTASLRAQTQWRRYIRRKNYISIYESIVVVQAAFRRWYYGVVQVALRRAALQQLQNCARCWLAVRSLEAKRQHRIHATEKAIVCQSLVRGKVCLERFALVRSSVRLVQAKWRMYRWIRTCRRKWQLLSALATSDLHFRFSQKGAFKIVPRTKRVLLLNKQALARCGAKRIALTNASTWVPPWHGRRQNLFRHRSHVKDVRLKYDCGVRLEHLVRRKISLKMLCRINQAAVALQEPWVYIHHEVREHPTLNSIQPSRNIASKLINRRVSRARKAAKAAMRTLIERSITAEDCVSNTTLHGAFKRVCVLNGMPKSRGTVARRLVQFTRLLNIVRRNKMLSSDKATRSIGLFIDPWKEKIKKSAAALMIQRNWRGFAPRSKFRATIRGIVTLQSMVRRLRPKEVLSRGKSASVRIQQTARCWLAAKKVVRLEARREMRLVALEEDQAAAIRIQKAWRGFSCRADCMHSLLCVLKIQSWWRCVLQQNAYEATLLATIALQSIARGFNARIEVGRTRTFAATSIQRHVRGLLARQNLSLQQFAATEIQKLWRGYQDAVGYIMVVVAAIKIESFYRMIRAKRLKLELANMNQFWHDCATKIQSSWHMLKAKRQKSELKRLYDASVKIQGQIRRIQAYRKASDWKRQASQEATTIQCLVRKKLAMRRRLRLFEQKRCVPGLIKFQAISRMVFAKKTRQRLLAQRARRRAAIKVQSVIRRALAMRQRRKLVYEEPGALQQYPVDVVIAANVQAKLEECQSDDVEEDAFHRRLSRSQGMIRGYLTRKNSHQDIRKSISLIKEAELRSKLDPSMRLGARMDRALTLLKSSSSLTEIMNIVCTLELATRFSKECCEEFVQANATEILLALLCDCNKSLPHVELLYYLMCTLSNVSRHKSLIKDITRKEAAEAFLYLIRMYGSEDAIFCSAVALLEMCALQNKDAQELIATPTSRKRLESIHKQWARKLQTKVVKESPFKIVTTPQFVQKKLGKAKTDMLILGIAYDLNSGVSTLERVLTRAEGTRVSVVTQ